MEKISSILIPQFLKKFRIGNFFAIFDCQFDFISKLFLIASEYINNFLKCF